MINVIKQIGFLAVLFPMLTLALIETGTLTSGIIITAGLNFIILLLLAQIVALMYGFTKSLAILYKSERHPLYSPERTAMISTQSESVQK